MAPSLFKMGAAALAYTTTAAAAKTYQLVESLDSSNFFDSVSFFESNYNTGKANDIDPTSGFVNYRNKADASSLGLIATQGDEVYIGVDHATTTSGGKGRSSVRVQTKSQYNSGLFIGKFTHLPKPVCGSWPAYWMVGPEWPANGEIDIYENWNTPVANQITLHTDGTLGECLIDPLEFNDALFTANCDNNALGQFTNQGCGVTETNGQWGSASGGVYATEWQDDHISIWSWANGAEPADIQSGKPDPTGWGTPHLSVSNKTCETAKLFKNLSIVLNLDFCGVSGSTDIWGPGGCQAATKTTCEAYVGNNPDAFADVFFKIAYIKVYDLKEPVVSTTSTTASTTSTTSTSSSTSTTSSSSTTSTTSSSSSSSSSIVSTSSSTSSSSSSIVSSTSSSSSSVVPSGSISASVSRTSTLTSSRNSTSTSRGPSGSASASFSASVTRSVTFSNTSTVATSTKTSSSSTVTDDEGCDPWDQPTSLPGSSSSKTTVSATTTPVSSTPTASATASTSSSSTVSDDEGCDPWDQPTGLPGSSSSSSKPTASASATGGSSKPTKSATTTRGSVKPTKSTTSTGGSLKPTTSATTSSEDVMVTSTVSLTRTWTITSCKPEITNCPNRIGEVTVETTVYTTVCPMTATESPTWPSGPQSTGGSGNGNGNGSGSGNTSKSKSTTYVTKTSTVESTTTIIKPAPTSTGGSGSGGSGGSGSGGKSTPTASPTAGHTGGKNSTVSSAKPVGTGSGGSGSGSGSSPSSSTAKASSTPTSVVVSGGVKAGVSLMLMAGGALFAFAL